MEPTARLFVGLIAVMTIGCGLYCLSLMNAWRRKERMQDEGRPLRQQQRFFSFTRMNTTWNARLLCAAFAFAGVLLLGWAVLA